MGPTTQPSTVDPSRTNRTGRDETDHERWDRNWTELLQEVRVALTGVQILFAFLLTLPFTARFGAITAVEKISYVVTLLAAAAAAGLLIAPVSYHRIVFQRDRKGELVRIAAGLAQAGLVCVLVAMTGAVFVVVSVVIGVAAAIPAAAAMAAFCACLWYGLPMLRHRPE
jgi:hypothetical protein